MRSFDSRKRRLALSVLPLLLCLTSCAGKELVRVAAPEADRTEQVSPPGIPPASLPCEHDASARCNSDAEAAEVLAAYDAALAEANRRLKWLRQWFAGLARPPR